MLLSCERARHWALTEASQNLAGLAGLKTRAGPAAGRSAKANPRGVELLSSVLQASRLHDSVNVSVRVLSVSEGETMSRQGKVRYLALRVSDDLKSTKHDQLSLRESSSELCLCCARTRLVLRRLAALTASMHASTYASLTLCLSCLARDARSQTT